ncbi:MAG: Gfo/Idh/MocA family oxidoreductase [Synergistaceae bacterium]|jgi:predicted dehydrogenase|nr:Gfo/Idh/MocA family oxidoreductase [Synergistaceae bacterium]
MVEGTDSGGAGARLKYGLVGGGPGSFIASVHRAGIDMARSADIAAGCFSRDAAKNMMTGANLGIDPGRIYPSYSEMAEAEADRPDGIDFAVVTTPNDTHYAICGAFLENGIDVSCDKPLCLATEEALDLDRAAREKNLLFMVTYAYTGYPLVRQAREMARGGVLGDIRIVVAEYAQDWLAEKLENSKDVWRTDPARAGISCCVGDIGTHIENMVHFVTGLEMDELSAVLSSFVEGRRLDDNAMINVRYRGGAVGHYWPSQVAMGRENGLSFRIYGSEGALEWSQENPNEMRYAKRGQQPITLTRGGYGLGRAAARWTRMPSGHPEGLFAAWANIYEAFCNTLKNRSDGKPQDELEIFPTAFDGARGVKFVHDCVASGESGGAWVDASAPGRF